MNVTSQDIVEWYRSRGELQPVDNEDKLKEEKRLAYSFRPECKHRDLDYINGMDLDAVRCAEKHATGPGYSKSMQCVVDSIIKEKAVPEYIIPDLNENPSIPKPYVGAHEYSDASLSTGPTDDDRSLVKYPFIIKTSRINRDARQGELEVGEYAKEFLCHEAVVALYGTNTLRKNIPNFGYVYGITSCTPFTTKSATIDGKTLWCGGNEDAHPNVIYETVDSVQDVNLDLSTEDRIEIIFQLSLAIQLAYERFSYSNQDLNEYSYVLKKVSKPYYIVYPLNTGNVYVLVKKYIPVIIDNGSSTINVNGVLYGDPRDLSYEQIETLFPDEPNPLGDVYKLLLDLSNDTKDTVFDKLFWYFNKDETIFKARIAQRHYDSTLPPIYDRSLYTPLDFISYAHNTLGVNSPIVYNPDPSVPIYGLDDIINYNNFLDINSPKQVIDNPSGTSTTVKWAKHLKNSETPSHPSDDTVVVQEISEYKFEVDKIKRRWKDVNLNFPGEVPVLERTTIEFINWYENLDIQFKAIEIVISYVKGQSPKLRDVHARYAEMRFDYSDMYSAFVDISRYNKYVNRKEDYDEDEDEVARQLYSKATAAYNIIMKRIDSQ